MRFTNFFQHSIPQFIFKVATIEDSFIAIDGDLIHEKITDVLVLRYLLPKSLDVRYDFPCGSLTINDSHYLINHPPVLEE